jgi:hypothetical protein
MTKTTEEPPVRIEATSLRMRPSDMRQLTKATGRTLEQLLQSDESADKFQAMAFMELRRRHPALDADQLWSMAGDVEVEIGGETPDPTANGQQTISLPYADTGE